MEKRGRVSVRIDRATQEEAESILKSMGLSPAMAIEVFYRQIIFQRKMPFEIKCADSKAFHPTDETLNGKG